MSGKHSKTSALLAALVITFSGCTVQDPAPEPYSPDNSFSSTFNTGSSDHGSSQSAEDPPDSTSVSVSPPDSTDSGQPLVDPSDSSDDPAISDPSDPQSTGSGQSSSTIVDNPGGPSSTGGGSSVSGSGSSSTQQTSSTPKPPDDPPVVVIPDIAVPTSPGTKLVTAEHGVMDYSNADQGYVSAKYTGDRSKCKLQVSANGETYNFDVDINGKTQYFPLSMGNGTYTIVLYEKVEGTAASYSVVLRQEVAANMPNPRSPYLYSNRYVSYTRDSECVYKAAELCAGKKGSIEKIAAIFQWVSENITYDNQLAATVKKSYCPDPDTTMKKKTGICYDYASLMAAMLRSQSIPTRLVIGYASPDIYHAWNEIYTEQTGWITPELLLKNNGYNLVDATFYSGAKDKKQIADYISNTGNYSSLYYY